ncbi:MAG TPA: GxxExxY protein [Flavobacteriales bacterium]|nr:GxxExxY protein [Flavobacteriales bacterium]HNU55076.1 GxxExxY protein [Flavobacteriales bacterium]
MNPGDTETQRARVASLKYNELSELIIEAAIEVHRELGPGLLESIYEMCLAQELREHGVEVTQQMAVPIIYKGRRMPNDLRLDLLVDDRIIVEVKAVEEFHPVHQAQLLTYLKLTDKRVGLLLNFHSPVITKGIKRMMNGYLIEGE